MNLDLKLFRDIEQALGERMEQYASELVSGKATDHADYRFRVGRLKGLQEALESARLANSRVIGIEDRREG